LLSLLHLDGKLEHRWQLHGLPVLRSVQPRARSLWWLPLASLRLVVKAFEAVVASHLPVGKSTADVLDAAIFFKLKRYAMGMHLPQPHVSALNRQL